MLASSRTRHGAVVWLWALACLAVGSCLAASPRGIAPARSRLLRARRPAARARAASRLSDTSSPNLVEGDEHLDEYLARLCVAEDDELEGETHQLGFNVGGDINKESDEKAEFALMYKLRKELGDADFKYIFGSAKVSGPPLDGPALPGR
ncbi:hypothetical protein T492DRAFT_919618 [Pavlovales sp. CCMP2436]|nr:hypothetical protein T492DRAFT_919618 [Pavlovales sp. CCMP2436]|mmetsp:Transcript_44529/g.110346  ORF Transcript_44529/g.110346 Transcript_44529/m.110346 type:complete len:150 (+) Transcript_44529:128-577(+)